MVLTGAAEEVWKAGKARKDTDLSAPTFTIADGVGGAGWGRDVKALESGNMKDPQITFLSLSAIGSETVDIIERIFKLPIKLVEPVFQTKKKDQ